MHRLIGILTLFCVLLPASGEARDGKLELPDFGALSRKAIDSVNITLDPWLLRTIGAFIGDDEDDDSAATKRLLAGIQAVQIRSYEFATDFAYPGEEIEAIRRQLTAPGWSQLMQVRGGQKSDNVDIYIMTENNRTQGFALISSDPRQFTIINVAGSISIEDLPKLEKQLHLPKMAAGII